MTGLTRTLKLGTTGLDVEAWTRGAHRYLRTGQLGDYTAQGDKVRRTFGVGKRTLAKKAAKKAGLPAYGVVGPALDRAMRDAGAYDDISDLLFQQHIVQTSPADPRDLVCEAARFYLEHARQIAYSQARPIPTLAHGISPPDIPNALDCSGLAITAYWIPGLIDKLGWQNSNGYGNTWTLAAHGHAVRSDQLKPGDLVFYGACSHVAIYEGGGKVITNGSYPMSRQRLMYRHDYWGSRSYL